MFFTSRFFWIEVCNDAILHSQRLSKYFSSFLWSKYVEVDPVKRKTPFSVSEPSQIPKFWYSLIVWENDKGKTGRFKESLYFSDLKTWQDKCAEWESKNLSRAIKNRKVGNEKAIGMNYPEEKLLQCLSDSFG